MFYYYFGERCFAAINSVINLINLWWWTWTWLCFLSLWTCNSSKRACSTNLISNSPGTVLLALPSVGNLVDNSFFSAATSLFFSAPSFFFSAASSFLTAAASSLTFPVTKASISSYTFETT